MHKCWYPNFLGILIGEGFGVAWCSIGLELVGMCNLLLRSCSFGSLDIGVPKEIFEWIISWKATRKIPVKVFIFLPNCEFLIRGLIGKKGWTY